jgi:hypothetical protein
MMGEWEGKYNVKLDGRRWILRIKEFQQPLTLLQQ